MKKNLKHLSPALRAAYAKYDEADAAVLKAIIAKGAARKERDAAKQKFDPEALVRAEEALRAAERHETEIRRQRGVALRHVMEVQQKEDPRSVISEGFRRKETSFDEENRR